MNAFDKALGAALMQMMEQGHMQPIYYASKALARAERNYNMIEQDNLGIVYAITKFRHYLLCNQFILHVDHQALIYFVNKATLIAKMARWMLLLQEFNFEIKHTPGVKMSW